MRYLGLWCGGGGVVRLGVWVGGCLGGGIHSAACNAPAEEEEGDERGHARLLWRVCMDTQTRRDEVSIYQESIHAVGFLPVWLCRATHVLPLLHVLDQRPDHQAERGADGGEQGEEGQEEEVAGGVEGLPQHVGRGGVADEEEDGRGEEDGVEGLIGVWCGVLGTGEGSGLAFRASPAPRCGVEWNGKGRTLKTTALRSVAR